MTAAIENQARDIADISVREQLNESYEQGDWIQVSRLYCLGKQVTREVIIGQLTTVPAAEKELERTVHCLQTRPKFRGDTILPAVTVEFYSGDAYVMSNNRLLRENGQEVDTAFPCPIIFYGDERDSGIQYEDIQLLYREGGK